MSLIDTLLPRYTYRRLLAATVYQAVRRGAFSVHRLESTNWRHFKRYSGAAIQCNVCGDAAGAYFDFPDLQLRRDHRIGVLRETLQCNRCGATMRHRTLAAGLLDVVSNAIGKRPSSIKALQHEGLGGLRVLDTDAFSPISTRLRKVDGYVVSSYVPDLPFNVEIDPGRFNVDLERIGFADASFDVVLTSDVAEHIRDIDAAHSQIARILRPGGHYVFTVPYDDDCATHHVLVETIGEKNIYLVPQQLHGDPLTGGILAYRVFGRALYRDLDALGFDARLHLIDDATALIIQGDVFTARKRSGPTTDAGSRS